MNIASYLDSTYLKTPQQSGLSEDETREKVLSLTEEAVENKLYAVMIRPEYVALVREFLNPMESDVKIGTVIGFHEGTTSTEEKLEEAEQAIEDGVDELDYVVNFEAFKKGEVELVKREFIEGSRLGLSHGKVVKWIIEIAALTSEEIAGITSLIAEAAHEEFSESERKSIFVKSSTGFYKVPEGTPNGATKEGISIMKQNARDLPIKAAGGVRTPEEAQEMIKLGVTRIGTSSALALLGEGSSEGGY